jgi:hypothetical protein
MIKLVMIVLFAFAALPLKAAEVAKAAEKPVTQEGAKIQLSSVDPLEKLPTIAPGAAVVKSSEPVATVPIETKWDLVLKNNTEKDLQVFIQHEGKWADLGQIDAGQTMSFICNPGGFLSFKLKAGMFYEKHLRPTCPGKEKKGPKGVTVIPETNT